MPHNPACVIRGCSCVAVYGPSGTAPLLCPAHRLPDMIDMSGVKCVECNARPVCNEAGQTWTHCFKHSRPKMKRNLLISMYYIDGFGRCCKHDEVATNKCKLEILSPMFKTSFEVEFEHALLSMLPETIWYD